MHELLRLAERSGEDAVTPHGLLRLTERSFDHTITPRELIRLVEARRSLGLHGGSLVKGSSWRGASRSVADQGLVMAWSFVVASQPRDSRWFADKGLVVDRSFVVIRLPRAHRGDELHGGSPAKGMSWCGEGHGALGKDPTVPSRSISGKDPTSSLKTRARAHRGPDLASGDTSMSIVMTRQRREHGEDPSLPPKT